MAIIKPHQSRPVKAAILGVLIFILVFIGARSTLLQFGQQEEITLSGRTMGTTYHIKYIDDALKLSPEQVQTQVDDVLKEVNRQMSTFIPTSEISRFNKLHQINTPFPISKEFATVVATAMSLNKVTQGALDITVGPLVNIWSFGPTKRTDTAPSAEKIAQTMQTVGIGKLKLTEKNGQFYLVKTTPNLYIDLSSIAKGFGVDQVARYLVSLGVKNYMVEIGGEIYAQGKNERHRPWEIGIEDPRYNGTRAVQTIVGLANQGMATSGDYRNYFEQDGKRFTHEINPNTGYPVQHHLASITVIAPNTMIADGLSTGLFVLGEDKALEVAKAHNLAVYLIIKQGDKFIVKMSPAFAKIAKSTEQ